MARFEPADGPEDVRQRAGDAFENLHQRIGDDSDELIGYVFCGLHESGEVTQSSVVTTHNGPFVVAAMAAYLETVLASVQTARDSIERRN